jgi:hypothetical protein
MIFISSSRGALAERSRRCRTSGRRFLRRAVLHQVAVITGKDASRTVRNCGEQRVNNAIILPVGPRSHLLAASSRGGRYNADTPRRPSVGSDLVVVLGHIVELTRTLILWAVHCCSAVS